MQDRTYFLGANTAQGFFSCYDSFCRAEDGGFLWIIKSGPGSGKSTLMRRVAAEARKRGHAVETALCSGDPDSLDGVFVPELRFGVMDGTSPHVLEPRAIGADSLYLDFSPFYDVRSLKEKQAEFNALYSAYKEPYRDAYRALAEFPAPPADTIPQNALRRFDAAICCRGVKRLHNLESADTVDREELQAALLDARIVYLHPLFPTVAEGAELNDSRILRTDIPIPDCSEAFRSLAQAKKAHDELEAAYRAYIDFGGVEAFTRELLRDLFK